jgi:hypothetical protein
VVAAVGAESEVDPEGATDSCDDSVATGVVLDIILDM